MWMKTGLKISLVLLFCLFGLVKGSCTSYGHSCWGAHGKRSDPQVRNGEVRRSENQWKILKLIPNNNDDVKQDAAGSQLFSDTNIGSLFDSVKTLDTKVLDIPGLSSNENLNAISPKFLKKKYLLKHYNKPVIDTTSNEDFSSADSSNSNLDLRDDYKAPNYRLIRMLKKDLYK